MQTHKPQLAPMLVEPWRKQPKEKSTTTWVICCFWIWIGCSLARGQPAVRADADTSSAQSPGLPGGTDTFRIPAVLTATIYQAGAHSNPLFKFKRTATHS